MDLKNIEDIYPLSPVNEATLARYLHTPEPRAHYGRLLCTLRGRFDASLFGEAWRQVVRRHSSLRAFFAWERLEKPLRLLRRDVLIPLELHDWRGLSNDERRGRLEDFLRADFEQGFHLSEPPLLRLSLCRMAEDEHRFVLSHHRMLLDGRSVRLIFGEALDVYESLRQGSEPRIPHEPPYREFAAWLKRQDGAASETFWRESLKDSASTTPLAIEPDATCLHSAGMQLARPLSLPPGTASGLASLAEQQGLSLSTLVAGAWALLLSRYSGEQEVTFGVSLPGLPPAPHEAERMIGAFTNTLPLRMSIERNAPLIDWLRELKTREDALCRFECSSYLHAGDGDNMPLRPTTFETRLLLDNDRAAVAWPTRFEEFEVCELELTGHEDAPLNIAVSLEPELTLRAAYDGSRFDEASITRMLGHLRTILEAFPVQSSRTLAELPLLSPDERHQLLVEWNDTAAPYAADKTIHELFEQRAQRTPDALALVFGHERISYQELNARANQLAHHLRSLGVGAEVLVGLCLERSMEMVVGLLAILKAGGAYVPLDPTYPVGRLSFMMEDARVPVLITQEHLLDALPAGWAQVVLVDEEAELIAAHSTGNPQAGVSAEGAAYVIYTSGSTGTPKGVATTHRGVVRLVRGSAFASFSPAEVFLQLAPVSFDASTFEVWGALLNGASLVVMPPHVPSLEELAAAIRDYRVTTLWLTAGLFHLMVDEQPEALGGLRQLLAGGDVLSAPHVTKALAHLGTGARLVNGYGPTEGTTFACCHVMHAGEAFSAGVSVPIGRPIANTTVYLLDAWLNPVVVGVTGQLYIGGDGLARGYLGRPGLTAERFIPHPYAETAGERLYATGDLARQRPGGEIEFLGRIDMQVKVSGFRVELPEVEAALAGHPGVGEAVVVALEVEGGGKRLVAYVTARGQGTGAGELRAHLRNWLPEYMVPSAFVELDEMPLTPNGKVDRRALPSPDRAQLDLEHAYAPPTTDSERALAEIWAEVLGLSQVGVDDNFFELGGDSIRSIQVRAKAQNRGLDFSVQQLFEHQTIRELAARSGIVAVESATGAKGAAFSLISTEDRSRLPGDVEDAYPLSALQAGMVFHSDYNPGSAVYHDIFSIHLKVASDMSLLAETVEELLARHPVLRTSFDVSGYSEPLQLVHAKVETPFAVTDLRHLREEEQEEAVSAWFASERTTPFEWERAPLMRIHVHLRAGESLQFNLSFHHAILDGWSMASMLTELFGHYLARLGGQMPDPPPTPSVAFSDFVALERQTVASQESREFWRQSLSESSVTRMPRWPLAGATEAARGAQKFSVTPQVLNDLKRLSKRLGLPFKSVLLAAHLRVLMLLGGNEDVMTGVVFNGRPEEDDGERVLGLFLNSLPFRMRLGGGTWEELARAVFEREREMLPHRRFPLAEVQRMKGGASLFETLFFYTHFHVYDTLPRTGGVEVLDSRSSTETNFPFEANFHEESVSGELTLTLTYDAAQFRHEQIEAAGGHYLRSLAAVAATPSARYEAQCLLSDAELRQLLVDFNETHDAPRADVCLHELFEAQAAKQPGAVALVAGDEQLTYAELDARANQLARRLLEHEVAPESLVAICLERSAEMVVALLAVLKAGAAYLPLDPAYPSVRLAYMLEDSAAPVLIASRQTRHVLPGGGHALVLVDEDAPHATAWKTGKPHREVSPDNLAYVIYTSGSTGRPKGVQVTHRSVVNFLHSMGAEPGLDADDVLVAVTSLSFDIAALEMFLPLAVGARIVLASRETAAEGGALGKLLDDAQATAMQATPATWRMLLESGWKGGSGFKVLCGGEALAQDLAEELTSLGVRGVWNLYGPTETTIWSSLELVRREERRVSIGRPIEQTQIYILDRRHEAMPLGVAGELYIGGDGVARGYLRKAGLTAERFVPDPYGRERGGRMYRTGDLARYLPDGRIECLGRLDNQVKLRGHRIELGEVEAAVSAQEGIRECVVALREDMPGDKRLVAYVVADGEQSVGELRHGLKGRLPDYMIPAAFVRLDALPLTPNGKVDRKRLPAPEGAAQVGADHPYVAPRTHVEEVLAGIWAGALGVERVGVHDDFFQLGGHSLTAVLVVSRVRAALRMEIPLKVFVDEAPTIEKLATLVEITQIEQASEQELSSMLDDLNQLSEDEVKALLTNRDSLAGDAEHA
jgi:amino acid adenylation domain-containing protein